MPDKPTHKCGVTAVFGHPNAPALCYDMQRALQHRGPEGAGIALVQPDSSITVCRDLGSVEEALKSSLDHLSANIACGHNRYATSGVKGCIENLQPFAKETKYGWIAVGHNGNIPSADIIRSMLVLDGDSFASSSDTEVFLALIAGSSAQTLEAAILDALRQIDGSFCFVIMSKDTVWAVSDPHAIHPLVLGQIDGAYVVASESCALKGIHATFLRDVQAGELVTITKDGVRSTKYAEPDEKHCMFESIYFARPDSVIFGSSVAKFRMECGRILADEAPPPKGSIVVPIPQSAIDFANGYANQCGAPIVNALLRLLNTRSFLQPDQQARAAAVHKKLSAIEELIRGEIITFVDDSVVRSTTAREIIALIRAAGAREVHARIACPPIRHPCKLGIDMSTYAELAAAGNATNDDIRRLIGADSLAYLSLEGQNHALKNTDNSFCQGCLTGIYPARAIGIPLQVATPQLSVPA